MANAWSRLWCVMCGEDNGTVGVVEPGIPPVGDACERCVAFVQGGGTFFLSIRDDAVGLPHPERAYTGNWCRLDKDEALRLGLWSKSPHPDMMMKVLTDTQWRELGLPVGKAGPMRRWMGPRPMHWQRARD